MLQNLLSKQQKKKLTQEYYLRLATVVSFTLSASFVVGCIALLPTYMEVVGELDLKEGERVAREKDKQDNNALQKEVARSEEILSFMESSLQQEKLSTVITDMFSARPDGVRITGFSYDRTGRIMGIEGFATSRSLVVPFARTLEAHERFESVPVQISDLAKNTDLDFRLNVQLSEAGQSIQQ